MKILALDDNPKDLEVLELMLREIDPQISLYKTKNEEEFLDRIEKHKDFSLIIMDIVLGGAEHRDNRGIELLELITRDFYSIPVCLISGHFIDKIKEVHRNLLGHCPQFIGFIDKMDYSADDLVVTIEKAQSYLLEQQKRQEQITALQWEIRELQSRLKSNNDQEAVGHLVQRIFKNLHFSPKSLSGDLDDHRAIHVLMHINDGNDHVLGTRKKKFNAGYQGYGQVWEYRYSDAGRILIGLDHGRKDVLIVTKHAPWHK